MEGRELDSAIERLLGPPIRKALLEYVRKEELGLAARKCHLPRARLSEILHQKRPLSLYYLIKFLDGGIVTMKQMLTKIKIEQEPIRIGRYLKWLALLESTPGYLEKIDLKGKDGKTLQQALDERPQLRDRCFQAYLDAPGKLSDALKLIGF
jgi:hypothetical protein